MVSKLLENLGKSNNIYLTKIDQRDKNSFGNNPVSSHPKNYYKYVGCDMNENKKLIIASVSLGALTAAFSAGLSKLLKNILEKEISKKFAIFYGILLALIPVAIGLEMSTNKKKLKPISKEEQIIKEKQIKDLIHDIAKKKNVEINGICIYDYSKNERSQNWLATYDTQTGYITITSKFKDTDLNLDEAKPLIVHELTHAKQHENIARSKDGIYNLNKISILNNIKTMDEETKKQILNTPDEKMLELAKNNIKNKPEDFTIVNKQLDAENEAKKLKAIKMYLTNPNISKYNLPLMFDEKYYSKLSKKGPISELEEQKVKTYLDYMSKDSYAKSKDKTIGKSITATINYINDPSEKEAYEAQNKYIKTGKIE